MLTGSSRMAVVAVLGALSLAACADSGVKTQTTDTEEVVAAATPEPVATIDPEAQPAVDAYNAFMQATNAAEMAPFGPDDAFDPAANYAQYSFDPARTDTSSYVYYLHDAGLALRGTPPATNVRVKRVKLAARPYPNVVLTDCATTTGSWLPYQAKSGKPVPTILPTGVTAPPPYRTTVTVIYYKKHWGVRLINVDRSTTCSA